MTGWADIAQQNQALLTRAIEKLAAAERERDTARDLAVSLENQVHRLRDDHQRLVNVSGTQSTQRNLAAFKSELDKATRQRRRVNRDAFAVLLDDYESLLILAGALAGQSESEP